MRDKGLHAFWWNRELRRLWPQAAMVLGDQAAHILVDDVLLAADSDTGDVVLASTYFIFGFPSVLRGRPTANLRRAPSVALVDDRVRVEMPNDVGWPGELHEISVPMDVAGWAPATLRVRLGLDADPTAETANLNLIADVELDIDLPGWLKVLTGLAPVERGLGAGPFATTVEAAAFALFDTATVEAPVFGALRYSRRELQPPGVMPQLVRGTYGAEPTGSDRIDYWDIVLIADGWGPAGLGTFEDIVKEAEDRLTALSPSTSDPGAAAWSAYADAIRIWSLPLEHDTPSLSREDGEFSAIQNMAQLAEAGLIVEDHLSAEYPGAPPTVGRTTWVVVRRGPDRALAFGNIVLLNVDPGETSADTVSTLVHELGHLAFVGLADEYQRETNTYRGPEPAQPNLSTSRTPDKWALHAGVIDPQEGAYDGFARGIFRPEEMCRMREASIDPMAGDQRDFCRVCHDAIATGILGHLSSGSARLRPPLGLRLAFTWPFVGRRELLCGAGIGRDGHVAPVSLPYLELDSGGLPVATTVEAVAAAVRRPLVRNRWNVNGPPDGSVRVRVEGTHPNVGFPAGVEATQTSELRFVEALALKAFRFRAVARLRQVSRGRNVPVGGELRATADPDTGDFGIDLALRARGGHGQTADELRLRTWTRFTLAQAGRPASTHQHFSFRDAAARLSDPHSVSLTSLETGHYSWWVESRLAAHAPEGSAGDGPGPWILASAELDRSETDHHFAIVAPEPVDAPPRVPVPLAAGRVRVTVAVDREGRVRDPVGDSAEMWSRFGFLDLTAAEARTVFGTGHVRRVRVGSDDLIAAWADAQRPVPPEFGPDPYGRGPRARGRGLPDIGRIERFVDRLPPRDFVRTTVFVMVARSWSPAHEPLRMDFQVTGADGEYADVPPSPLAIKQRGSHVDADAPGLSLRVTYWEYVEVRDVAADSEWRCRAVDSSGRTSDWSALAPLHDFNVASIPARLGVPA